MAYNAGLKRVALLDALMVSLGFVLRAAAGAVAAVGRGHEGQRPTQPLTWVDGFPARCCRGRPRRPGLSVHSAGPRPDETYSPSFTTFPVPLGSYTTVALTMSGPSGPDLRWNLRAQNLFDKRY